MNALESLVQLYSPVLGMKAYTPSKRAGSSQGQNRLVSTKHGITLVTSCYYTRRKIQTFEDFE